MIAIYGLLVLVGGIMGHVKAASRASLIMGIVFGGLLLFAAVGLYLKKRLALWSTVALLIVLDAFFTYRFTLTHKFFPPGLFSLLTLVVLLLVVRQVRRRA